MHKHSNTALWKLLEVDDELIEGEWEVVLE